MSGLTREDRIRNLLGMAQKAGRIASGNTGVEKAVKEKRATYILVAGDASPESRKGYEEMATRYGIPCSISMTKAELGASIGREYRAAVALTDEGFGRSLAKFMGEGKN